MESYRGEGGGRKPKLSAEQMEELRVELKKKDFWTTKAVKVMLKEKFDIDYKSKTVRDEARDLEVYLVYLPPYSPDLNPIEYIWKSLKRILSLIFVTRLDEMKGVISAGWNEFSQRLSHAEGWIKRFLRDENYAHLREKL